MMAHYPNNLFQGLLLISGLYAVVVVIISMGHKKNIPGQIVDITDNLLLDEL